MHSDSTMDKSNYPFEQALTSLANNLQLDEEKLGVDRTETKKNDQLLYIHFFHFQAEPNKNIYIQISKR